MVMSYGKGSRMRKVSILRLDLIKIPFNPVRPFFFFLLWQYIDFFEDFITALNDILLQTIYSSQCHFICLFLY